MKKKILKLKGITKKFPGVIALKDIDFELNEGEVHAIIGENGAGKSTLVKIITGVLKPTMGKIYYEDREVSWSSPIEATRSGIAVIYQEPTVFPDLNVAENIFMGHQNYNRFSRKIKWSNIYRRTNDLMKELAPGIKAKDTISSLRYSERQLVEVAKAISIDAKIILMDEPTAALGVSESEELFSIIQELKNAGKSLIYISHRIEDISKVADRVTVLRNGNCVGTKKIEGLSRKEMIQMMVGREIKSLYPRVNKSIGKEVLRVENLSKKGNFKDISFSLHEGEILGLYGLIGSGRTEVAKAIFGLMTANSGKIFISGKEVKIKNPGEAIKLGISYVSENRDEEGLIINMDITSNITLPIIKKLSVLGWINNKSELDISKEYIKKLSIKTSSLREKVLNLSGGNKQKVSLAKWLAANAKILLFDEPTKGVDVGSKSTIHGFMAELTSMGHSILMISSELPEVLGTSDNIMVMHNGILKGCFKRDETTQEEIMVVALADKK